MRYIDNFDTLVALMTHLANVHYTSRTPSNIAKDLGLDSEHVANVLESFPAFFRKSIKTASSSGEHFYAVHARYARAKRQAGGKLMSDPLNAAEQGSMVTILTHVASQEQEQNRLMLEMKDRYRKLYWTNLFAALAALTAAAAAILK